jgi:hypothetical protein
MLLHGNPTAMTVMDVPASVRELGLRAVAHNIALASTEAAVEDVLQALDVPHPRVRAADPVAPRRYIAKFVPRVLLNHDLGLPVCQAKPGL